MNGKARLLRLLAAWQEAQDVLRRIEKAIEVEFPELSGAKVWAKESGTRRPQIPKTVNPELLPVSEKSSVARAAEAIGKFLRRGGAA